ncbi:cupin domain-containing protein [Natronococcus occultus]|uniref:Cupin domain-containing protein n=1 Tax=Natronococcus occultus SP4 TaxID=694430 RepID=L0JVE3_9EURY|nr:cupin domain-containing protein [Natronococcus occultus]AGB36255.1 cupin domain-containing protein [Natronococcus occultus SP4]
MEYEVVHTDDVPLTDLSEIDEVPSDLQMRAIDDFLPSEHVQLKLWYFEPGEEIEYHAHAEQEELYFALEGEFELTFGRDGETERREVAAGAFWLARPEVGHGHRNVGDEEGIVLAVGAPNVDDPGRDPGEFDGEDE